MATTHIQPMKVEYNYLTRQFQSDAELTPRIMEDIQREVDRGEWTLGPQVQEFEEAWAGVVGSKYAIGVSNGTDALFLLLKAHGIGPGDRVMTVPNTFLATVGAIIQAGATPVFCDIGDDYNIDWKQAAEIHKKEPVQAIIPVHWGGRVVSDEVPGKLRRPPDSLTSPKDTKRPVIIEDAAQAIGARPAGTMFDGAGFSLHPLKNVNVWGDGGMVTTDDEGIADFIRLVRNHGLKDRDTWEIAGFNHRLSTIQAIVGLRVLPTLRQINSSRLDNAERYIRAFISAGLNEITLPSVNINGRNAYHLFQVEVKNRNNLLVHLQTHGVEAKVHYPFPLHLQPAMKAMNHKRGDFPRAEKFALNHITLPCHQYIEPRHVEYVAAVMDEFYHGGTETEGD